MENVNVSNTSGEQRMFEYAVPYNHPIEVSVRAKVRTGVGIVFFVTGAFFIFLGIIAMLTGADTVTISVFIGLAALSVLIGFFSFRLKKPAQKNDNKNINFVFYDYGMSIDSEAGFGKSYTRCLYNKYKSKQFVKSITEMSNIFIFKILTGTLNGSPQYKKYYLPKDVVENKGEEAELKEFLAAQKENFYIVKEKIYK